jgi:hypothetical protein
MSPRAGLVCLLAAAALTVAGLWTVLPGGGGAAGPAPDVAAQPTEQRPSEALDPLVAAPAPSAARVAERDVNVSTLPCLKEGQSAVLGRVVDEAGAPVASARVAVLGAPQESDALVVRGDAETDRAGRFEVHAATGGDTWVVIARPTWRPAVQKLVLGEGYTLLDRPVALERGVSISGRVLAGDEPLDGVELELVAARGSLRARVAQDELVLVDGSLEWASARTTSGRDGAWTFCGLAPGRWVVRPYAFRCPRALYPTGALAPEPIDAPARGIDLRLPAALLAIDVVADGQTSPWAELELHQGGFQGTRRTDGRGHVELLLPPWTDFSIVVRGLGRLPGLRDVERLRDGERREIRLEAGLPAPATDEDGARSRAPAWPARR